MNKSKKRGGEKMITVKILDDTGHSEVACANLEAVKELVNERHLEDKFVFADSKFTNLVSLEGITELPNELVFTERLIGG